MKKIVSKMTIVLSIILFVLSIGSITSIKCLKGTIPLQDTIINSKDIIYGIIYKDLSYLQHKQVSLFYIGLFLFLASSFIHFEKTNKLKGLIRIVLSTIPIFCVIFMHNYIWFLILVNLYLITVIIIDFKSKDKLAIVGSIVGIIIWLLNIIQLIQHLQLTFNPIEIQTFQMELVELSNITLKIFALWLIPYTILLIKDITTTHKSSRTVN